MPIIRVTSGVRCLVDTGSSITLMSRDTIERLYQGERIPLVEPCKCKLITLGGPCKVDGEVAIDLSRWEETGDKLKIHMIEKMPREYGGIIGCDLLQRVGTSIRNNDKQWVIHIGRRKYRCRKPQVKSKSNIGVIRQLEDWRKTLKSEYRDVFFNEGETLGATGKRSTKSC